MDALISFRALGHLSNEELAMSEDVYSEDSTVPDINGFSSSWPVSSSHRIEIYIINRKRNNRSRSSLLLFPFFFSLGGYWVVVMNVIFGIHSNWWDIHVLERNSVKNMFVIHISVTVGILRMNESFKRKRSERRPRESSKEYPHLGHSLRWENKNKDKSLKREWEPLKEP